MSGFFIHVHERRKEEQMESIKADAKDRMDKSIESLKNDFNTIRTGRASSSLFDKIKVEYYGTPTPLNQVATISVPEARLVVIQPWDPTVLNEIEKAIQKSELSLNPSNDGKVIRINIPPLTEERRKEYVKMAKNMAEQARVAVRNIRRDANDSIKKKEKDSDITEDQSKKGHDDIQEMTDKHIEKIDAILEEKEKEIMEI
jgi:ribosome recycling factor